MGIVGYGDIGRANTKLANVYGSGLKRSAASSFSDLYFDHLYGMEWVNELMAKRDCILISTPLTEQTQRIISAEVLSQCANPTP